MIAWVTGGGTGIGRALAQALYDRGDSIVITGRREEILEKTAAEIRSSASKGELLSIAGDASNPAHIQGVVERAKSRWGPIQLLINNAGVNDNKEVAQTSLEDYQKALEI